MEDALDQRQRAGHLGETRRARRWETSRWSTCSPLEGLIERFAAQSAGSEVAEVFVRLRAGRTDRPARTASRRRGDPHGPHQVPRPAQRRSRSTRSPRRENERRDAAQAPVQVMRRAPAGCPRLRARGADPLDHAAGEGLRRDRTQDGEAPRRPSRARARQRTSARAAESHRLGPPAQPAATLPAGDQGLRGVLPVPGRPARPTRSAATSTTSSGAARGAGPP